MRVPNGSNKPSGEPDCARVARRHPGFQLRALGTALLSCARCRLPWTRDLRGQLSCPRKARGHTSGLAHLSRSAGGRDPGPRLLTHRHRRVYPAARTDLGGTTGEAYTSDRDRRVSLPLSRTWPRDYPQPGRPSRDEGWPMLSRSSSGTMRKGSGRTTRVAVLGAGGRPGDTGCGRGCGDTGTRPERCVRLGSGWASCSGRAWGKV
jgi:hypothetical protein